MILTFSKAEFVQKIIDGEKKHTIREDKSDRWHAGRMIQLWWGNPRNVKNSPHFIMERQCISIQRIEIEYQELKQNGMVIPVIKIDGHPIFYWTKESIALNDGFNSLHDFFDWFNKDFTGKIIHWTNLRYFEK
jgi:hypothetical protein